MKTLLCTCNRTMALDLPALAQALGDAGAELEGPYTTLCRREAPAFQRAAKSGEPLLVACTQEQRLFVELAQHTEGAPALDERPIHFVNIRETAGWARGSGSVTPKMAALLAVAQLPEPEPVPTVSYRSAGRCLVLGPADAAEQAAALLGSDIDATVLATGGGALTQAHTRAVHNGRLTQLRGHLGAFEATWEQHNPIDLDLCTRCNACIAACPEGAIDFSYSVDLAACQGHRACVQACEAAGAIDFARPPQAVQQAFDMVLDLRDAPAFAQHAPPQGYVHAGRDPQRLNSAVLALRGWVGVFEKPRFFRYRANLCAHSRNEQVGCTACIDVCSARAVRSVASLKGRALAQPRRTGVPVVPQAGGQGGGIEVDPHLCVGCGACTTVCPTGALAYATPGTAHQGRHLRTLLATYRRAGGRDALLLIHSQGAGSRLLGELGRAAQVEKKSSNGPHGLPARVIPVPVWHTASTGIDLWLMALAQGASQVAVLLTDEEAPDYRRALAEQQAVAQALMSGLGYGGGHLHLLHAQDARDLAALDASLHSLAPAQGVARPSEATAQADKRATLELALDHLLQQAPATPLPEAVALPAAGAPWGSLQVDADKCTLCLACVGACPAQALADNAQAPQLRFVEKNCVQCGLCVKTCPEGALQLLPRLWLADAGRARRSHRVLHEAPPFHCVRCHKPFGTLAAIERMIERVGQHPAFSGAAAERLRMCSDCRVVAMFSNPDETKITDL